jgi:hypothetical protein
MELAGLSGVILMLVKRRLVKDWPALFSAVCLELGTNAFLLAWMAGHGRYKVYFYAYWWSAALQALCRLAIIADIIHSFPGLTFPKSKVYLFLGTAGAVMLALSIYKCFGHKYLFTNWRDFATLLNHCVYVAWATFGVMVLIMFKAVNLGWHPLAARLTVGLFARTCGLVLISQLYLHKPSIRAVANGLDSLCSIAVFLFWILLLLYPPHPYEHEPQEGSSSHDDTPFLSNLLAIASSRERR